MAAEVLSASKVLLEGDGSGETLVLQEPLSFWGGIDPKSGRIVDEHHPQRGECIAGRVLVMPGTRGSTSSPGALADAIQLGNGPAAVILPEANVTILVAATIARELYGTELPVLVVDQEDYVHLRDGQHLAITGGSVQAADGD
ncbi:MAG TPA: DUF126 domain-containing protein [Acidobacteriota bacterium]|nr:DUF126 domain-containing protein [Acidobacteriota bacterium]